MSNTVLVPGGIVHRFSTIVECPLCEQSFDAGDYDMRLHNAKNWFIGIKCPHCKSRIGLAAGVMCDFFCIELEKYQTRINRLASKGTKGETNG